MKEEKVIHDWLNGSLDSEEAKALLDANTFASYKRILDASEKLKAPNFDIDSSYRRILASIEAKKRKQKVIRLWTVVSIAASIAILLTLFIFPFNNNTIYQTGIAENSTIYLPDSSKVVLNANSKLEFNEKKWDDDRTVHLQGEAYFHVAKGKKFSVVSNSGKTRVLGTRFNIFDRENFYEVNCFHGKVEVEVGDRLKELSISQAIRFEDNQLFHLTSKHQYPLWVDGFIEFKSVPISLVIKEIENNFPIKVVVDNNIDLTKKISGKFSSTNLTEALQSFALPLGLSFEERKNKVYIKPLEK